MTTDVPALTDGNSVDVTVFGAGVIGMAAAKLEIP